MIKKELEDYINKNYDKLLQAAKWITKNDTAGDLLNDVLEYLLGRKWDDDRKMCWYSYIVRAMIQQHNSPNHNYNKMYCRYRELSEDLEQTENKEYDYRYEEIIEWVQKSRMFKTKIKELWCKEIFIEYFAPQYHYVISGLTMKQVNELNKRSFEKVAKKYKISKSSARNGVYGIIEKIKKKYE